MSNQLHGKSDVESGEMPLLPMILERPDMRRSFIRKVCSIIAFHLLSAIPTLTVLHLVVVNGRAISTFFATTTTGFDLSIVLMFVPLITLCPLYYYRQRNPVKYILLGIFMFSMSFVVGLTDTYTSGNVILEAVILTAVVVISLAVYIFILVEVDLLIDIAVPVNAMALYIIWALHILDIIKLPTVFCAADCD